MKYNFYVMILLSGSFLHASHSEDQNKYLTAPKTLEAQVADFIEKDNQREQDRIQKIKDDRTQLLLVSAQVLGENECLTRVELKKIRKDLKVLEENDQNTTILNELKVIKKNHKRSCFIGSSFVADNILQEEKTSLKNVIKTALSAEIVEVDSSSISQRTSATQTDMTQEDVNFNAFGIPSAPPAPIDNSQR